MAPSVWDDDDLAPRRIGNQFYRVFVKRAFDILLVLASAPFVLPVIALCALALWIEGGRPFYTQQRIGRRGDRFSILKLRTMVRDADSVLKDILDRDPAKRREWDALQKLKADPRVTRVGQVLRVTSLDELPQLWNVLKGDMSLVGPRPMMPEQAPLYGDMAAYEALRPGITGLWQVSARNGNRFSHRNTVDATYEITLSFGADLRIVFRTIGVVLRGTGY
ncbi:sugar transferase [Sulfitobacter sp. TSTF-M16]|uniref:Sugar transferase n=2 Tax=Sulfitobacter aestuariivivens TaxID=2766981 RepID=A0A927CZR5_9RHOB|nr:sugar transferase [Sulfitobacter aestuariivivens]